MPIVDQIASLDSFEFRAKLRTGLVGLITAERRRHQVSEKRPRSKRQKKRTSGKTLLAMCFVITTPVDDDGRSLLSVLFVICKNAFTSAQNGEHRAIRVRVYVCPCRLEQALVWLDRPQPIVGTLDKRSAQ